MKVQELLVYLKNKNFNLENELQVKKYLPLEVKRNLIDAILYESFSENNGVKKIDSVQRYLSYVKYMLLYHTNLEYLDEDYDLLVQNKINNETVLDYVLSFFQEDNEECLRLLKLSTDDYIYNNSFNQIATGIVIKFNNLLNQINIKLEEEFSNIDLVDLIKNNIQEKE